MGGAPRAVAIAQRHARGRARARSAPLDRRAPAVGWWATTAAVWAAKRDPQFVDVVRRHLRYPAYFVV